MPHASLPDETDGNPAPASLAALRAAECLCRRCPLYKDATQAIHGEGPDHAAMMLVGEQPGDQEDRAGMPFVGPAGRVLDRALADAGIARKAVFVTNAVKHFKHEMRGTRRLHKRPNAYEIDQCRWWQEQERRLVNPRIVVALGATAARSLLGRAITVSAVRGKPLLRDGGKVWVTIHPSSLLRIRNDVDKERAYRAFVADLEDAARLAK